jgi:hypothetical protein
MSELVRLAFVALGPGVNRREVELVADALRERGDAGTLAVFGLDKSGPRQPPVFDHEAFDVVAETRRTRVRARSSRWICIRRWCGRAGARSRRRTRRNGCPAPNAQERMAP